MRSSEKLEEWMNHFYNWSSDEDNKDSRLIPEFTELKNIIKEMNRFEHRMINLTKSNAKTKKDEN